MQCPPIRSPTKCILRLSSPLITSRNMDSPIVLVGVSSFATYLLYHYIEPTHPVAHLALLGLVPGILVGYVAPATSTLPYLLAYSQYWYLISLFTVFYRLSPFHPLASYPGPLPAKISKLWAAYITLREGNLHHVMRALHAEHGEVVRVGPNELSFSTVDAVEPILTAKQFPKGPYYNIRHQGHLIPLDGYRDFTNHGVRRKPWMRAMNHNALKEYEGDVKAKVTALVDALEVRARRGEGVDISKWMSYFAFDFMGSMIFNQDFGLLKAGKDVDGFWHTVEEGVVTTGWLAHITWILPILNAVPGVDKNLKKLVRFGQKLAQTRVRAGSKRKDLFYYLMGEDEPSRKEKASIESLTADGMMAVIAGSDTTATALSHLWYFLVKHPECYKTLRAEILAENEGDFTRQANMPYLNACINEALRLYPPIISGLQRRVETGSGGKIVTTHFVPEETQLPVHVFTLHRSCENFSPLPDTFWPDRWLTGQTSYTLPTGQVIPASEVKTDKRAFIPFSVGPQNCAGKGMAAVEMRAVTEAVVRRFESMYAAEGEGDLTFGRWEKTVRDVYVQYRGPLVVRLQPAPDVSSRD
ncbi:high nitrogen upregulated cytochrome P450 monooxygenase 1 [Cytidiella melzeri]|nr:high nitrogen upregulated cytochrome P450 monooxygenase 1 [Cytidiella melzeri]